MGGGGGVGRLSRVNKVSLIFQILSKILMKMNFFSQRGL